MTATRPALRARYHGPTNTQGTRIMVGEGLYPSDKNYRGTFCYRHTYAWNYALDHSSNYAAAAQEWLDRYSPGAEIDGPALVYKNDHYFAWRTN